MVGEDTSGTQHPRILSARERFHDWSIMKDALDRLLRYIDTNDIGALFDLLHELEIDFNQQYPISDPFYKKPLDIDKGGGKGSGTLTHVRNKNIIRKLTLMLFLI